MAIYTTGDLKSFSTLSLAKAAIPGNLLGHGKEWIQAYRKAAGYAETLDFYSGFSHASAVDYIDCEAMVSHGGLRGKGIVLDCGSAAVQNHINFGVGGGNNPYCRFHGFCITCSTNKAGSNYIISNYSDYTKIYDNLIYDSNVGAAAFITGFYGYAGKGLLVYNNQMFNLGDATNYGMGIYATGAIGELGSENIYANNSVYNCSNNGIRGNNKIYSWVYNNYSHCLTTESFSSWSGANSIVAYNISSDATADDWGGAGNLINKAAANQFMKLILGAEDLHIKSTADCFRNGADMSAYFTTDCVKAQRRIWATGAFEPALPEFLSGSPGLGTTDNAIDLDASGHYEAAAGAFGNIGTADIIFEGVTRHPAYASILAAKRNAQVGYEIGVDSSARLYYTLEDSTGNTTVISAVLSPDVWYHWMLFCDRSGSAQFYVNGTASGAAVAISPRVLTLDTTEKFVIGGDSAGAYPFRGAIAHFAAWTSAAWLDTHLQADLAKERFMLLSGAYPQIAEGDPIPQTFDRNEPAYLDKRNTATGKQELYLVGSNWPRMCRRNDANGNTIEGYFREGIHENLLPESDNFSLWTAWHVGDTISANAIDFPDGRRVVDGLIADAVNWGHGRYYTIGLVQGAWGGAFSIYAKAGNKNFVYLANSVAGGIEASFGLVAGSLGPYAVGANCLAFIDGPFRLGNSGDFYRCTIVWDGSAIASGPNTFVVLSQTAGGGALAFTGDAATINTYLGGAQVECNPDFAGSTSLINTAGASVVHAKDTLRYYTGANIGGEAVGEGLIQARVLVPAWPIHGSQGIASLNQRGTAADRVELLISTSVAGSKVTGLTRSTGGNAGDSAAAGAVNTGKIIDAALRWKRDDTQADNNGVPATIDDDCDMPVYLDLLDVGSDYAGGSGFTGLISRLTFQAAIPGNLAYHDDGDVLLYQTGDDGEINFIGGLIEMCGGLATAAYLSLFGGNDDDDGRADNPLTWWGNVGETEESKRYVSKTQYLLKAIPGTSGNLLRIEDAILDDLDWMIRDNVATEVTAETLIPGPNRIEIRIRIVADGQETVLKWAQNWKAM